MKKQFKQEVADLLASEIQTEGKQLIEDSHTSHLPYVVKKYIFVTECFGKEKVRNVRVTFEGKIRSKPTDGWMKLKATQVSSFENATRLFFMKASKMGIPAVGLHRFKQGKASMVIKLLGLFKVVDVSGKLMDQSETVTHFNDICLLAPSRLIDEEIRWEEIDPLTVKGYYTCNGITVSATLFFNKEGYLTNFVSNDRYDLSDAENPKLYPFSTPVTGYKDCNGVTVPQTVQTIYTLTEGEFVYGEFTLKSIKYNIDNR